MSVDVTKMPKLGFGLMRLPEKNGELDLEQLCKMVDAYMASGMNYFDTAYMRRKIREHYQKSACRALSA